MSRDNSNYRTNKYLISLYIQPDLPVMTALFGEKCIGRQPAKQARQGKPMYRAIQGEGDHPEVKQLKQKTLKRKTSHLKSPSIYQ